ncbi:MAG: single-stranded DNA-binding protein [Akkermansiaceae bacterium]|nr:single-stranded DNA-binding protein [Akkermansiaceae bacterium]
MNEVEAAGKILESMLVKLGFHVQLETLELEDGPCLNILTDEGAHLIGKYGDRLEDLQYLTNRILCKHYPDAPRVKVDCDQYRANQEKRMLEAARAMARQVLEDGKSRRLKPLNAYYRRLAHNALAEIDGISTSSPRGDSRYKRIEISKA